MSTARVVSIHCVQHKRGPAELLEQAHLIVDQGIEGDYRSRKGKARQVTLIEQADLRHVAQTLQIGNLPGGASRRQIVVEGISLQTLLGGKLRVGSTLIEIHDPCPPCDRMETAIGPGAKAALAERGGVCARVLEGGVVRPGDAVEVAT